MKTPKIIAFEGCDGSGKTTIISDLQTVLSANNLSVKIYSFHDRSYVKKVISNFVSEDRLSPEMISASIWISALATMEEALLSGVDIILLDRYVVTGAANDHFSNLPATLTNKNLRLLPPPHLSLYFDINPREALKRIIQNRGRVSFYETEYLYTFGGENSLWRKRFLEGDVSSFRSQISFLRQKKMEREFALSFIGRCAGSVIIDASEQREIVFLACLREVNKVLTA